MVYPWSVAPYLCLRASPWHSKPLWHPGDPNRLILPTHLPCGQGSAGTVPLSPHSTSWAVWLGLRTPPWRAHPGATGWCWLCVVWELSLATCQDLGSSPWDFSWLGSKREHTRTKKQVMALRTAQRSHVTMPSLLCWDSVQGEDTERTVA